MVTQHFRMLQRNLLYTAVTRAARKAFGLDRDSRMRIHHTDGRAWVNRQVERLVRGEDVETYDLIFIDADKPNYINYYERALTLLRPGGLAIVDRPVKVRSLSVPVRLAVTT